MDEGMRRHIKDRLLEQKKRDDDARASREDEPDPCVDDEAPALDRDRVLDLQRRTLELYGTPAFKKALGDLEASCGDRAGAFLEKVGGFLDDQKAPLLGEFGFEGWAGARAAERAIASQIGDAEVRRNATELFELVTAGFADGFKEK